MNTIDIRVDDEVGEYVGLVRLYLGDLDDEVRDELTDGLAADLGELVTDRGIDVLPDPELYADELRTAAGLPPRSVTKPRRGPHFGWARVNHVLDECRKRWLAWVGGGALRQAWGLATELRPVWWFGRAWLAVVLLQMAVSGQNGITLVPEVGNRLVGVLLLLAATATSVRLGRIDHGPGVEERTRAGIRLMLLAINGSLLLAAPYVQDRFDNLLGPTAGPFDSPNSHVIEYQNRQICELVVTDVGGKRVTGYRVEDEMGNRLPMRNEDC